MVGDGPVYVSFDIDALDPAFAPGTGTPEIGGLTTREAQAILRGLKGLDIVGGDVVEVAPQYDATTNTAHAGAQMLFEILSLMVFSPSRRAAAQGVRRRRARRSDEQVPPPTVSGAAAPIRATLGWRSQSRKNSSSCGGGTSVPASMAWAWPRWWIWCWKRWARTASSRSGTSRRRRGRSRPAVEVGGVEAVAEGDQPGVARRLRGAQRGGLGEVGPGVEARPAGRRSSSASR